MDATNRDPIRFAFSGLLIGVCVPILALAQDTPANLVRGVGEAAGATSESRKEAVRNAQLAILVEKLEALNGHGDLAAYASLLEKPDDFIVGTRLVHLDVAPDKSSTKVEIEGRIERLKLRYAAARTISPGLQQRPRVLVLVGQRVRQDDPYQFVPESATQHDLELMARKYRFGVVDAATACPDGKRALRALSTEPGLAIQLGTDTRADVVVLAKATIVDAESSVVGPLQPRSAQATIRIVRVSDGATMAEKTFKATVRSINPAEGVAQAIRDACAKAESMLFAESVLAMNGGRPDGLLLVFEGRGVSEWKERINACLSETVPPDAIEELDQSASIIRLRVAYSGSVKALVESLTSMECDGARLCLVRAVNGDVTFALE